MNLLNCEDREAIRMLLQEYPGVNLLGEAYAAKDWASKSNRKLCLAAFRTWLAKSSGLKEKHRQIPQPGKQATNANPKTGQQRPTSRR